MKNLTEAFSSVGIKKGDVVYLTTQLYGIGPLCDAPSREEYLESIYTAIYSVIGSKGTLIVPTFTQQVGRFGLPFVLEETESLTGIFGEYIRSRDDSVRSLHPVFSVAAVGFLANDICENISPIAFGADSIFDRLVKLEAKAICMGFDYYSGHIVSLMHHVETAFGVPYYYNKIIESPVYMNNKKLDREFVINVKYIDMECNFNYKKYIDAMEKDSFIVAAKIGRGIIYSVNCKAMFDIGISLLKEDMYSFLGKPPQFRRGERPLDGPPEISVEYKVENWVGFYLEGI